FLKARGVKKGDRVILNLPNTPHYVACYYGILKAGGVVVQCNPMYTERELRYLVNNSEASIVFAIEFTYPRIKPLIDEGLVRDVIICKVEDFLPFPLNLLYPLKKQKVGIDEKGVVYWKDVMKSSPVDKAVEINPKEDVAVFQYTGGTTGLPKAVMLTHYNLVANAYQNVEWVNDISPDDVFLGALPYFHVYGMTTSLNAPILLGCKIVLIPDPRDIRRILKAIQKHRVTIFCGVPTLFNAISTHPDVSKYDLSSVRVCISGAAPLPIEVKREFERITGGKLVEGYGLSETSPVTHANPVYGINKEGSIGIPFPSTLSVVVDDEGTILHAGEVGELAVKGPQVMKGYYKMEEETKKVLINGWLLTGDVARFDEDGYFYIVDRKKDVIIAGGYNIYPREVEEALYEHPAVLEAAVVGVPDPYRGETVKAFVVLRDEFKGKISDKDIIDFCKERLAAYKVPKMVEFREELPKSAVGKVLRRVLKEEELKKTALT
ncbi:MAG TPA: long-chain fatty acid--CoA ligase, partial [Methanomicrobia archaeon]|nr:long-chain fatty acid--CoA ligase [Methanomicrobia archaeon]HEX58555.1 long-chain fatty acid--CoA ligase [Methanomicrobia archaeon]